MRDHGKIPKPPATGDLRVDAWLHTLWIWVKQALGAVWNGRGGLVVHTHETNDQGGTLDHGAALTGLTDDDHTQYILVAGTRAFSGDQSMGGNQLTNVGTPSAGTDAATKDYVDTAVAAAGSDWIGWAAL